MANIAGFDASTQGEMLNFSTMPVQKKVLAMMTASDMKPNKKATGSYLQCEFTLLADGQYKGRKVWTRLNLSNPNKQAEDIAQRELGAICKAVGILKPHDSADLHSKPLLIDIGVEKGENGTDQNKIEGYYPAAAGASFTAPAAPTQQPGPATAPAAPSVPPWMRK